MCFVGGFRLLDGVAIQYPVGQRGVVGEPKQIRKLRFVFGGFVDVGVVPGEVRSALVAFD